ncbi:hypothetical protein ZWY2020_021157 [Hordeum vulgare]|nr:hypothetical protein ZWY2020_021157 [Hordeum vulgare]
MEEATSGATSGAPRAEAREAIGIPASSEVIGLPASRVQGSESDDEIKEIFPRASTAGGGVECCSASGELGQIRGGSRTEHPHCRWEVLFRASSTNSLEDRQGFIILHLEFMWATIRDEEGDILAGRYLQKEEFPKAGQILVIDGYRLLVQEQSKIGAQIKDSVSVPSHPIRFGGRFWVLADQDEEMDEELGEGDVLAEVH